jgi:cell division protein FtsQ
VRRADATLGAVARGARDQQVAATPERPSMRERLRQLFKSKFEFGRRARADQQRQAKPQASEVERPQWPRRLARRTLELGAVVGVAWGLLLAGREVYDYATTSSRFEVQHIIYAPTAHVDDDTLRELLAIEPGTNILACDLAALSERIAAHPWVALATVTRNLPDTLEIHVLEHEAEALVLAGRFYLVNGEGRPFKQVERGERGELPIITGIDRAAFDAAAGQPVPQLVDALALLDNYAAKQRPRLGELHIGDDGAITLYTAESGTALVLGRGEFEARLERWDALRAALGERADGLAVVHLDHESKPDRRDRVVARFANERDSVLLAAATTDQAESEPASEPASAERPSEAELPARRSGRRKRIPTYE